MPDLGGDSSDEEQQYPRAMRARRAARGGARSSPPRTMLQMGAPSPRGGGDKRPENAVWLLEEEAARAWAETLACVAALDADAREATALAVLRDAELARRLRDAELSEWRQQLRMHGVAAQQLVAAVETQQQSVVWRLEMQEAEEEAEEQARAQRGRRARKERWAERRATALRRLQLAARAFVARRPRGDCSFTAVTSASLPLPFAAAAAAVPAGNGDSEAMQRPPPAMPPPSLSPPSTPAPPSPPPSPSPLRPSATAPPLRPEPGQGVGKRATRGASRPSDAAPGGSATSSAEPPQEEAAAAAAATQPPLGTRRAHGATAPEADGAAELPPVPPSGRSKPAPLARYEAARAQTKAAASTKSKAAAAARAAVASQADQLAAVAAAAAAVQAREVLVCGPHELIEDAAYALVAPRRRLQLLQQLCVHKMLGLERLMRESEVGEADEMQAPPACTVWAVAPPPPFPRNDNAAYLKTLGRIGDSTLALAPPRDTPKIDVIDPARAVHLRGSQLQEGGSCEAAFNADGLPMMQLTRACVVRKPGGRGIGEADLQAVALQCDARALLECAVGSWGVDVAQEVRIVVTYMHLLFNAQAVKSYTLDKRVASLRRRLEQQRGRLSRASLRESIGVVVAELETYAERALHRLDDDEAPLETLGCIIGKLQGDAAHAPLFKVLTSFVCRQEKPRGKRTSQTAKGAAAAAAPTAAAATARRRRTTGDDGDDDDDDDDEDWDPAAELEEEDDDDWELNLDADAAEEEEEDDEADWVADDDDNGRAEAADAMMGFAGVAGMRGRRGGGDGRSDGSSGGDGGGGSSSGNNGAGVVGSGGVRGGDSSDESGDDGGDADGASGDDGRGGHRDSSAGAHRKSRLNPIHTSPPPPPLKPSSPPPHTSSPQACAHIRAQNCANLVTPASSTRTLPFFSFFNVGRRRRRCRRPRRSRPRCSCARGASVQDTRAEAHPPRVPTPLDGAHRQPEAGQVVDIPHDARRLLPVQGAERQVLAVHAGARPLLPPQRGGQLPLVARRPAGAAAIRARATRTRPRHLLLAHVDGQLPALAQFALRARQQTA